MNIKIRHKMIAALIVSLAIVVILGVLTFYFVRVVVVASRHAAHSNQVLLIVERIRAQTAEMQLEAIRHDLPGDSTTLTTRASLRDQLDVTCNVLDSLFRSNAVQSGRVDKLRIAIDALATPTEQPPSADKEVGVLLADIQQDGNTLKREQQADMTRQFYNFITAAVTLLVLWIANILILLLVLNRNLKARDKAETKLSIASTEIIRLYEHAPCGYFTVNEDGIIVKINSTLLRWLGYESVAVADKMHAVDLVGDEDKQVLRTFLLEQVSPAGELEVALARKNNGLIPVQINYVRVLQDGKQSALLCSVVDNTARKKAEWETQRAYKELESFSYSVSHDLRAPLRSINGYGQILLEDYAGKMDDEGKRLINVIISNGKRMGQLIDDLLEFSRMSRKEISGSNINMNEFVNSIVGELMERESGRKIELKINDLAEAYGDPSMLRQVWVNLISNALKYSRKRETTTIEIGSTTKDDQVIYFVKDNGAGFSMDYYNKLFGVFQRLHKWQEFEGTGVGLAIVKRIVERHGGQIWAESKPDQGAAFYYSIPGTIEARKEIHPDILA